MDMRGIARKKTHVLNRAAQGDALAFCVAARCMLSRIVLPGIKALLGAYAGFGCVIHLCVDTHNRHRVAIVIDDA